MGFSFLALHSKFIFPCRKCFGCVGGLAWVCGSARSSPPPRVDKHIPGQRCPCRDRPRSKGNTRNAPCPCLPESSVLPTNPAGPPQRTRAAHVIPVGCCAVPWRPDAAQYAEVSGAGEQMKWGNKQTWAWGRVQGGGVPARHVRNISLGQLKRNRARNAALFAV